MYLFAKTQQLYVYTITRISMLVLPKEELIPQDQEIKYGGYSSGALTSSFSVVSTLASDKQWRYQRAENLVMHQSAFGSDRNDIFIFLVSDIAICLDECGANYFTESITTLVPGHIQGSRN